MLIYPWKDISCELLIFFSSSFVFMDINQHLLNVGQHMYMHISIVNSPDQTMKLVTSSKKMLFNLIIKHFSSETEKKNNDNYNVWKIWCNHYMYCSWWQIIVFDINLLCIFYLYRFPRTQDIILVLFKVHHWQFDKSVKGMFLFSFKGCNFSLPVHKAHVSYSDHHGLYLRSADFSHIFYFNRRTQENINLV